MFIIRQFLALAAVGVLCACAQSPVSVAPENIAAIYVNHLPYMGFACPKLLEDQARITQELEAASQKAHDDPSNEKTGPMIARLKGESVAVATAIGAKKCAPAKETKTKNS